MSTTENPLSISSKPTVLPTNHALEIAKIERAQQLVTERIQLLQSHRMKLQKYLDLIHTLNDDDDDDEEEIDIQRQSTE